MLPKAFVPRRVKAALLVIAAALFSTRVWALEVRFDPVAPNVYAHIGDKGPRSIDNEGLNANVGLVVTNRGAVLIDSGSTFEVARAIDAAVKRVTGQPVRWVINTGGQDHRWLGNGYFKARGAEVIAHASAPADMQARGGDQLAALRALLGTRVEGTVAVMPTRLVNGLDAQLNLGGMAFVQFKHRGGGHTPGDMMVWLPSSKVLFTGDIVYTDRLLAILPVSNTRAWLDSFAAVEQLTPLRIVPGHGDVTSLARARAHTHDYLAALRAHAQRAVDEGIDIDVAVKAFDSKPFQSLLNASELMSGNANRVYLEVERE